MIDFKKLHYSEFEILIALLLKRAGHQIVHGPGPPGTSGPDYETISPDGNPVIVEVKHFTRGIGKSQVVQFIGDLQRYKQQKKGARGLLVISSVLSAEVIADVAKEPGLAVWDANEVTSRVVSYPDIQATFESAVQSKQQFELKVESLLGGLVSRSGELSARLQTLPRGRETWATQPQISIAAESDYFSEGLCRRCANSPMRSLTVGLPRMRSRSAV